jgi:hypothetical protein
MTAFQECLAPTISVAVTQCGAITMSIARGDALVFAQPFTQLDIAGGIYRARNKRSGACTAY